jgi:hypothetical protein
MSTQSKALDRSRNATSTISLFLLYCCIFETKALTQLIADVFFLNPKEKRGKIFLLSTIRSR